METGLLQRFMRLITAHLGLQVRETETDKVRHAIQSRMTEQQLGNPEAYYQLLASDTAAGQREWEELALPLTIGESYFFRDSGQFSLLRQRIIPELIERNSATRSLRIWSAGCSTGEEPYSMAILVHELLPSRRDWNIVILGTDVNKNAIAAARRGIYRQHSFRILDQEFRDRYFHHHRGDWELDKRFRSMVAFRQLNLLRDPFPDASTDLQEIDLILCRNVFIYFDRPAKTHVVTKFTNTLKVGGYLVTGHAELHDQKPSGLRVEAFPESIIYRRDQTNGGTHQASPPQHCAGSTTWTAPTSIPLAKEGPTQSALVDRPSPAARTSPKDSRPIMLRTLDEASHGHPTSVEKLYDQARRNADIGHYEAAIRACRLALTRDAFAEKPYHLLAQIAEIQGDITGAKDFLKKMLYVAPASVVAHLELGALYAGEQDLPRARKMYTRAIELLKALPPDAVIEPFLDLPASQLLPEVHCRLERLGGPSSPLG
jgi:chemotaxis protein methyltransferase CheR